jgi:hypothetical protein
LKGGESTMGSERIDEHLLVGYLLGDLEEAEESRVEDLAFSDTDFLAALEDAEADLIDAYVRGGLSQRERRAFERRFLAAPSRRSKVEFAMALAKVATQSTTAVEAPGLWQRMLRFVHGWAPALQFAAACSALVIVGGSAWLVFQNAAMHSRLAAAEVQRAELAARNQSLTRQLENDRGGAPVPLRQIPALVLLPGVSRGTTQIGEITLPLAAQIAHIDIQLEARDDYPQFRAELRSRAGQEVLTFANLRPTQKGDTRMVSFEAPASALVSGQYELSLKGVGADGSRADVGYYYFVVKKQ